MESNQFCLRQMEDAVLGSLFYLSLSNPATFLVLLAQTEAVDQFLLSSLQEGVGPTVSQ